MLSSTFSVALPGTAVIVLFLTSLGFAAEYTRAFKDKYIATTDAWVDAVEFTPAERAAMQAGVLSWQDSGSHGAGYVVRSACAPW